MSLKISRLSTALGAEITGVNLSEVSDAEVSEIKGIANGEEGYQSLEGLISRRYLV